MESSQIGLMLNFWNIKKEEIEGDHEYFKSIVYLIVFHYFIIMLIWSLFMVLFTNPGYLSQKYVK